MPSVDASKCRNFEVAMRRFKKAVEKADIIREVREREFYESKSEKKKRAKNAARKRWAKNPKRMHLSKTTRTKSNNWSKQKQIKMLRGDLL